MSTEFDSIADVLKKAFQVEVDGFTFYSMTAESATKPAAKKLFERLARDETEHQAYIRAVMRRYEEQGASSFRFDPRDPDLAEFSSQIFTDDFKEQAQEGVILIAATNRPDVLDSALLRPGRFDRQIVVDRPDVRGREGILKVHTKKIPLSKNVDLSILAKGTPGFSGADLANMVNEAALLASRNNKNKVEMEDFEAAKDKVLMGTERRSLLISDDEKRSTAYHEAGHALVAKLTPGSDPVHKVTIIPRGQALGATTTLPIDEKHNYSKDYCERMLIQLLGGRSAEKLVLDQLTTGAGNDIERATELARKMVCEWGMSEKLGPMTFGKKQEEIFLGREISQHRDYSEKTAQAIDSEVRRIIENAATTAEKLLKDNIDKLHALAQALLDREILDGNEIDRVINQIADNKTKASRTAKGKSISVKSTLSKESKPGQKSKKIS